MTRGHNIVAYGWAGACNPHPYLNPPPTLVSTLESFILIKGGMEGGIDEDLIPAILRKIASKQNIKTESLTIFMLGPGWTESLRIVACGFFSQVDPELLSEAADQLSELNVLPSGFTPLQVSSLFESVATGNSKLELLSLSDGEILSVSPKLFADSLAHLKEVTLSGKGLTVEHQKMMFLRLQQEDIKLQKLTLDTGDLDESLRFSRFLALEYRRVYLTVKD